MNADATFYFDVVALYFVLCAQDVDQTTATCKSPGGLRELAWIIGIVFGVIELGGHFLR